MGEAVSAHGHRPREPFAGVGQRPLVLAGAGNPPALAAGHSPGEAARAFERPTGRRCDCPGPLAHVVDALDRGQGADRWTGHVHRGKDAKLLVLKAPDARRASMPSKAVKGKSTLV